MKKATLALSIISAIALAGCQKDTAEDTEAAQAVASESAESTVNYTTDIEKQSYALGASMGLFAHNRLTQQDTFGVESDMDALIKGFNDGLENKTAYSMQEIQQFTQDSDAALREKIAAKESEAKIKNLADGEAYLATNGQREEVTTTESGLQYEVLKEGTGKSPTAADTVKVHYKGTLIDGTEFDSSFKRGEPIEFPLNGVITGWTEGLQYMKEGASYRFHIPASLAYGERQQGPFIGPNSTLVFDVELIEVKQAGASE